MESPKLTHEKLKAIDNIEDYAYKRLFENYLKLELKGPKKLIDITSTDQESVVNRLAHNRPVPGMIYTFLNLNTQNLTALENFKTGKQVTFHDFTPILFCTSFNPLTNAFKGLNLNILPKGERLKFLQAYYERFKLFLERIEEKTEYNKLAVNITYQMISLMGKNPELFRYFSQTQGALFEYAYRSYNLLNLRKFRMIEYEEWQYIPFFEAKQSFKKGNFEKIYQVYWDNLNNKT
jgi:hypothetical protein